MGGDLAPSEVLAGARRAVEEHGIPIILVGRPEAIGDPGGLEVIPASEVIGMADDPAQGVRRKKDSSLVRAAEAVRDGKASAMVSAGNTGAAMASALLRMGRLKGVSRPAIATPIPVPGTTPTVLLDAGANAECQPEWLVQFAQMGTVYAQERLHIAEPRVGLLSIGEESSKGTPFVKAVHNLLADAPGIRFIGNVEGRDVMSDRVDVVVTDGFSGNVVLKTLEGGVGALFAHLRAGLASTAEFRAAAAVLAPLLEPMFETFHQDTYGGAVLLGVEGTCVISHGSSTAHAIVNALRVAVDVVEADVVGRLRSAFRPGTGSAGSSSDLAPGE